MTAGLLLLPAVLVGAFVVLLAATWLERLIGVRRSDRWPLPSDIDLVPLVVSDDPTSPSPPA